MQNTYVIVYWDMIFEQPENYSIDAESSRDALRKFEKIKGDKILMNILDLGPSKLDLEGKMTMNDEDRPVVTWPSISEMKGQKK